MKRILLLLLVSFFLPQPLTVANFPFIGPAAAHAEGDWKQTFDELCAKTQNAMAYKPEELQDFITRCDALKTEIEQLREPEKTIYLKRLQRCSGVFSYVLESKEKK